MKFFRKWYHRLGPSRSLFLSGSSLFLAGVVLTLIGSSVWNVTKGNSSLSALRVSELSVDYQTYTFIDPLIAIKGDGYSTDYQKIQQEVSTYIAEQKKEGLISATVYFRDIKVPAGFGINPDEMYTPASLYKVPIMMAYYKVSEDKGPSILSDSLTYTGEVDRSTVQEIVSSPNLVPGKSYSVTQLLEYMIRHSDNNATELLRRHLVNTGNAQAYLSVFTSLGIDFDSIRVYSDNMTAQRYSIFLRTLYNATYLNRDNSEKALRLLSETDFDGGIRAGVPESVLVAQKFGEVRMVNEDGTFIGKELNNCGIVYFPKHPYLLCVMTKRLGNDIPALQQTVGTISRMVYTGMQKLYP